MSKVLDWIIHLIPEEYRVGVAIKKLAYLAGKLAAGFLTARLVTNGKLTPDQLTQVQAAVTAVVAGGLETIHDWAKVKWPNATWL